MGVGNCTNMGGECADLVAWNVEPCSVLDAV